jgi:predicted amidohydrolase
MALKPFEYLRVGAAQYFIRPIPSFEAFADQVTAIVETAASFRCRLLVLPEYFTLQLISLENFRRPIHELVQGISDHVPRFVDLMRELARDNGMHIVAGTIPVFEESAGGTFNDSFFFTPSGSVGVQGKLHMTRFEREQWCVQPRSQLKVFETDLGMLAIGICYDVEFPEVVRAAAQLGAQILVVPSCTDTRQGFLRVRYCAQARTIENQIYVVHAPTVGSLPRVPDVAMNYGQASILTPSDFPFARDGILAEGVVNQEDLVIGDLDMRLIEQNRTFGTVIPLEDSRRTREILSHIEVETL